MSRIGDRYTPRVRNQALQTVSGIEIPGARAVDQIHTAFEAADLILFTLERVRRDDDLASARTQQTSAPGVVPATSTTTAAYQQTTHNTKNDW